MKNSTPLWTLLAIVTVALGIWFAQQNLTTSPLVTDGEGYCTFTRDHCEIIYADQTVHVSLTPEPQVETSISVKVKLSDSSTIEQAWIEGVNMYMGKIPVPLKAEEQAWTGWFMLGACSEPQMHWRMFIKIKNRPQPVWIDFKTSI